jgi:hypothetical protein
MEYATKTTKTLSLKGCNILANYHTKHYGVSARLDKLVHGGSMLAFDRDLSYVELIPRRAVVGKDPEYTAIKWKFKNQTDYIDFLIDYLPGRIRENDGDPTLN